MVGIGLGDGSAQQKRPTLVTLPRIMLALGHLHCNCCCVYQFCKSLLEVQATTIKRLRPAVVVESRREDKSQP